jgi:hypothetical protein
VVGLLSYFLSEIQTCYTRKDYFLAKPYFAFPIGAHTTFTALAKVLPVFPISRSDNVKSTVVTTLKLLSKLNLSIPSQMPPFTRDTAGHISIWEMAKQQLHLTKHSPHTLSILKAVRQEKSVFVGQDTEFYVI